VSDALGRVKRARSEADLLAEIEGGHGFWCFQRVV